MGACSKYDTTVKELEKANPDIEARSLQIGSEINIPGTGKEDKSSSGIDIVQFYLDKKLARHFRFRVQNPSNNRQKEH